MPKITDLADLKQRESDFQQHLLAGHITYIGPHPNDLNFLPFLKVVNELTPLDNPSGEDRTKVSLMNKNAIEQALSKFPADTNIDVYAGQVKEGSVIVGDLPTYCETHKIMQ